MMLYPPVAELVKKVGSRYQLVNLVARRARALSITKEGEIPSERKPVSEAIDEVYTGRLTIVKDGSTLRKERKAGFFEEQDSVKAAAETKQTDADENQAEISASDDQKATEG